MVSFHKETTPTKPNNSNYGNKINVVPLKGLKPLTLLLKYVGATTNLVKRGHS